MWGSGGTAAPARRRRDPGGVHEQHRIAALGGPTGGGHRVRGVVARGDHDVRARLARGGAGEPVDRRGERVRLAPGDRRAAQALARGYVADPDHLRAVDRTRAGRGEQLERVGGRRRQRRGARTAGPARGSGAPSAPTRRSRPASRRWARPSPRSGGSRCRPRETPRGQRRRRRRPGPRRTRGWCSWSRAPGTRGPAAGVAVLALLVLVVRMISRVAPPPQPATINRQAASSREQQQTVAFAPDVSGARGRLAHFAVRRLNVRTLREDGAGPRGRRFLSR